MKKVPYFDLFSEFIPQPSGTHFTESPMLTSKHRCHRKESRHERLRGDSKIPYFDNNTVKMVFSKINR